MPSHAHGRRQQQRNNLDVTVIPKQIDVAMGKSPRTQSVRVTVLEPSRRQWTSSKSMTEKEIRESTQQGIDLLDALSRSGSLPIACSELHVLVAVAHGFENNVMGTVVQDNVNPLEQVEQTYLTMTSILYGCTEPSEMLGL